MVYSLGQTTAMGSTRDNTAFFLAGLFNNVVFVVYLSAAEAIFKNKAGLVLLCSVLPGLLSKMSFPFFVDRFSYASRVTVTCLTLCLCCIGVAVSSSTVVRLACICLSSMAGSLGEVTYLALTSLYHPQTVGWWASGTGLAGVVGSTLYVLLRSFMSSRQSILAAAPFSLGMLASYLFILTPHRAVDYATVAGDDVPELESSPSRVENELDEPAGHRSTGYERAAFEPVEGKSLRRVAFPWLLRKYILPLMLVYFFEYVINQGISPTLDSFSMEKSAAVSPSDAHHKYAVFQQAYQTGVFVSRSSISFFKFPRLWAFPPLQLANCVVLLAAALFGILPHHYCVIAIMFFEGLVGGGMYVNAFYKLRTTMPEELKSWALGTASVGDAAGVSIAALVNIFIECGIRGLRGEDSCK